MSPCVAPLLWVAVLYPVSVTLDPPAVPGGVIPAEGKVLYVQAPKGGVEALDLKTGNVLWSTEEFARPLAVVGTKLLVEIPEKDKANVVRLATLDGADKGKQLSASDPIQLPDWVNVGTAHGRSYTSQGVAVIDKTKLLLRWEARAWYAGGARPTPEMEKAARKEARGFAEVDLATGKVTMPEIGQVEKDELIPKDLQQVQAAQYWTGSTWETKPLLVGTNAAVVSRTPQGEKGNETLTLHTWDRSTGKVAKAVELMQGKSLWLMVSADRRHLFAHQALTKDKLPEGEYVWRVFSLQTGKLLAKVPFEGAIAVHYADGRVYLVTEKTQFGSKASSRTRTLKCLDAATGALTWERAIYAPPVLPPLP
jgi:outer membrane protein assembly factor BamB